MSKLGGSSYLALPPVLTEMGMSLALVSSLRVVGGLCSMLSFLVPSAAREKRTGEKEGGREGGREEGKDGERERPGDRWERGKDGQDRKREGWRKMTECCGATLE